MEKEKIIKALECCGQDGIDYCRECPIKERCRKEPNLPERMALSLINELTEDNEKLKEELAKSYKALDEQMNFYCSFTQSKVSDCPIYDEVAKAKADTVRKMQRMVNRKILEINYNLQGLLPFIDQIAEKMLGDINND